MALKTLFICLFAATALAVHEQPIRRQNNQASYYNTTTSASPSQSPVFTYDPTTARPASSPSSIAATSTSSTGRPSLQPTGTIYPAPSFSYFPTTSAADDTCGGVTLNVLSATLDWWYDQTIIDEQYSLQYQRNDNGVITGWTIFAATTTLDVTAAVSTESCAPTPITVTAPDNSTFEDIECSSFVDFLAPTTEGYTVTAFISPTIFSGTGRDDIPQFRTRPPPVITSVPGTNITFGNDSPYVYFNAYEIVSSNFTKKADGNGTCNSATRTYNMTAPYAFSYTGPDPEQATDAFALITGDIDSGFASAIGQPSLTLGSFTALPTMVVIVEQYLQVPPVALIAHTEFTQVALDLPTQLSSISSSDGTSLVHVESTDRIVRLPTTTIASTSSTTTTATDALQVLTQALGPAIMQGLGATTTSMSTRVINILGTTATVNTVQGVVVQGQTALAGGSAITADGTIISVPTKGKAIIVGTSTISAPDVGTLTLNGMKITETPVIAIQLNGQTLTAGGSALTVNDIPVSLMSGGGALAIGSSTTLLITKVITVASQTITANGASQFVFTADKQTLSAGGIITVSDTTISLDNAGTALIVNGRTTIVATSTIARPAITVDGQVIKPTNAGVYVVSGQTLTPGAAITLNGLSGQETLSLDKAGSVFVEIISGTTVTSMLQAAPTITIGGQQFTGGLSTYVINGQTLTPGGVKTVTIGRTSYIVSLAATPTVVEVEQFGTDGKITSTVYETLYTPATTIFSSASTTSPSTTISPTLAAVHVGRASSKAVQATSILLTITALFLAAFL